jgi:hypothetical protein
VKRTWAIRGAVGAATVVAIVFSGPTAPAGATAWNVAMAAGGSGQAGAGTLAAPAGLTGTCGTGGNKSRFILAWTATPRAAAYTVQQSTTSSTTGFSTVATGVASTNWTSPDLGNGTYWYRVVAVLGNWSSSSSAATAPRTITGNSCA